MPGLTLLFHETRNFGCNCNRSRAVDQMCRQDSKVHLSSEEAIAAEESLSVYCKPVELYNILQRRALRNPSFLQRCLHYKIEAKLQKRIQLSISLSGIVNDEVQAQNVFPLFVLLARPLSDMIEKHSVVYRLSRASVLTAFSESGRERSEATFVIPELKKLLAEVKSGSLSILLVTFGETGICSGENDLLLGDNLDLTSVSSKFEGYCLWGKLPLELLYSSWEKSANLSLGLRSEMLLNVEMRSSFLEPNCLDVDSRITFQIPPNSGTMNPLKQVQVKILAQEVGGKEKSPYDSYAYNDVPISSLSHIIRELMACQPSSRRGNGKVVASFCIFSHDIAEKEFQQFQCHMLSLVLEYPPLFNGIGCELAMLFSTIDITTILSRRQKKFPNLFLSCFMNKTVTEDFSCPFCLVQCSSFMGLRYHLCSSHDLFNFEFWVTEEYQAVNVSVKTDIWRSEIVADGVDPRLQTFFFCSKPRVRRRLKNHFRNAKHVHAHAAKMDSPQATEGSPVDFMEKDADGSSNKLGEDRVSKALFSENHMHSRRHKSECNGPENPCSLECMGHVVSGSNISGGCAATAHASASNECTQLVSGGIAPPTMLQFAKTRKLSVERMDPRNQAFLQKRQFFHSHRAQPMALEQVFSDRDSEDEVDDDIADFEDRRLLDDFVDVTRDEKQIMHLWNSFVRKQRVLADGHIPWACEAFSKLHGRDLVHAPALIWCWKLFMIKLWNHSLLDARTMNSCNIIIENYQKEISDPKQS